MTNQMNLKGSRWTKVHAQGQANFASQNNVMDITIGKGRCQAEVTYETSLVRNFEKAAYWLLRSLKNANALEVLTMAAEKIQSEITNVTKDDENFAANGDKWTCEIEKLGKGVFKVRMSWEVQPQDEQMTLEEITDKPAAKKRTNKKRTTTKRTSKKAVATA